MLAPICLRWRKLAHAFMNPKQVFLLLVWAQIHQWKNHPKRSPKLHSRQGTPESQFQCQESRNKEKIETQPLSFADNAAHNKKQKVPSGICRTLIGENLTIPHYALQDVKLLKAALTSTGKAIAYEAPR